MADSLFDLSDARLVPARPEIADVRLRGHVAAERYVVGETRAVVVPSAPLRRTPRFDAGLETEAVMGDAVTAYGAEEGFVFVQFAHDGYVGYLPEAALGPAQAPTHRVTALRSFLYPGPDLKQPASGWLTLGARLRPTETRGDYLRIASGYVFAGHCAPLDAVEPDYAATAERLVGTPYLWGGRTSLGLDCSGLVQLCLAQAGILAPRDADQQERGLGEALPPDFEGLRRGDLVFWRGHVGLMLDAARLIHANGHHMAVAVEPLAEAVARIREKSYGPVTSLRRLSPRGTDSSWRP
ncbi:C40 family peptidase [Methylobacterium sp. Leaf89]|uniref:C40 family peptidase n=1 Tax=Methylobacterium sp. Leaf89 TaxID=1736245 RepID=UPI000B2DA323|nr:C40 family peptidase [Methylobacterium sp. Leaf89]